MNILDRLRRDLASAGTLIATPGEGSLLITHVYGRALDQPAKLNVDPEGLQSWLAAAASRSGQSIWNDVDAQTGAYRLLLVHIDEEIGRYDGQIASLKIDQDGVEATPRNEWTRVTTTDLDPTEGEWFAEHPDRRPAGH